MSSIEQRFAKQRGEVQAELASKRSEVNGRRAARDEERKVLDEALSELDAALADVESAIQVRTCLICRDGRGSWSQVSRSGGCAACAFDTGWVSWWCCTG